jgi:thiol-disulfide isomerase/thioredoxin
MNSSFPNLNATQNGGSFISNFFNKYGMYIGIFVFVLILIGVGFTYMNSQKEAYTINQEQKYKEPVKEAELMLFSTDWCPHCKAAKPEWEELKSEYEGKSINGYKLIFTEVNCTEETPEVESKINQYKIEGYPTVKLLKDGQVIEYDAKPTRKTMEEFLNTVL